MLAVHKARSRVRDAAARLLRQNGFRLFIQTFTCPGPKIAPSGRDLPQHRTDNEPSQTNRPLGFELETGLPPERLRGWQRGTNVWRSAIK
jgi:hypothetical protein